MNQSKKEIREACDEIKKLVQNAKLTEAAEKLGKLSISENKNQDIENTSAYFIFQLKRAKTRNNSGLISSEQFEISENKVAISLLNILKMITAGNIHEFSLDINTKASIEQISEFQGEKEIFGTITKPYSEFLRNKINYVRIFGMSKPVPLKDLYVRVHVLQKITTEVRWTLEELKGKVDYEKRLFNDIRSTLSGTEVINKFNKFIVLGKPGGGKTTFLKYLSLLHLDRSEKVKKPRLPFFITLKDYSESNQKLTDYILKKLERCNISNALEFFQYHFDKGNIIFLFDGLDEVLTENKNKVINEIIDLSDLYNNCQYIITCRIAAYNHWFTKFTDVELADFNNAQIEKFIRNWFFHNPNLATNCWTKLNETPQLRELANSPLLLTLLCIAYNSLHDFPSNRSKIYGEAIETLLEKWDDSKRIKRDELYKKLNTQKKESLISRVAFFTFQSGDYFFSLNKIASIIKSYFKMLENLEQNDNYPNIKALIESVEIQHGIWTKRGKNDIYSFSHLTFQEYFTSIYIIENRKTGTLKGLINDYLFDDRWREVIILVGNKITKADEFILTIIKSAEKVLRKNRRLKKFFNSLKKLLIKEYKNEPRFRIAFTYLALKKALEKIHSRFSLKTGMIIPRFEFCYENIKNLALIFGFDSLEQLDDFANNIFSEEFSNGLPVKFDMTKIIGYEIVRYGELNTLIEFKKYFQAYEIVLVCIAQGCDIDVNTIEMTKHRIFQCP